jgi:HEAT repeats
MTPDRVSLRSLRDAVAGRNVGWPRSQAMALLRASDYPNKHRDLEAVLVNEKEPAGVRLLAAANLGRMNLPAAVEILAANIGIADEGIRAVILTCLGRTGDRSTLDLLVKASREDRGLARSAAEFAASLLSYRCGIPGRELFLPKETRQLEPSRDGGFPLRLAQADEPDSEYCLRCLAGSPLGIEFSERVYRVTVLRNSRMVLFNRECSKDDAAARLRRAPAFLGVIAALNLETGVYHPTRVLLTTPGPTPGAVIMMVCRLQGKVVLCGEADTHGDRVIFVLRSVAHPGARPTRIEGTFGKLGLSFSSAFTSTCVTEKVQATPVSRGRPQ